MFGWHVDAKTQELTLKEGIIIQNKERNCDIFIINYMSFHDFDKVKTDISINNNKLQEIFIALSIKFESCQVKRCLNTYGDNQDPDQPAHPLNPCMLNKLRCLAHF